jgi:hypothetical protein
MRLLHDQVNFGDAGVLLGAYVVQMNRTASTSLSLGTWVADATRPRRLKFYDLVVGSEASPADNAFLYIVQRCTTAGTLTGVTPSPIDPADAATESDAGENVTIEPTYTANLVMLALPLNQRATFRWVANPGSEITTPATASNGLGIQTTTATGLVAITASVYANEQ